ncbi:hypothetical protein [Endothiovibrio diazotrophicus]
MNSPTLNTILNAWIFIAHSGATFMIREDRQGCWLSEQSSAEAVAFASPMRAAAALGQKRTGIKEWDSQPAEVPPELAEWTQILPVSVFNRHVQHVVEQYGGRLKA